MNYQNNLILSPYPGPRTFTAVAAAHQSILLQLTTISISHFRKRETLENVMRENASKMKMNYYYYGQGEEQQESRGNVKYYSSFSHQLYVISYNTSKAKEVLLDVDGMGER